MGLLKGGAIFGLGAAFGLIVARNRPDFRKKNSPDCPLQKKMKMNKAREMEKAKELEKANNPDSPITDQTPANSTINQPSYQ